MKISHFLADGREVESVEGMKIPHDHEFYITAAKIIERIRSEEELTTGNASKKL